MEKYCHAAATPATNMILKISLLDKTEDRASGDSVDDDGASIGLPLILALSLDNNCLSLPVFFPAGKKKNNHNLDIRIKVNFVSQIEPEMISNSDIRAFGD